MGVKRLPAVVVLNPGLGGSVAGGTTGSQTSVGSDGPGIGSGINSGGQIPAAGPAVPGGTGECVLIRGGQQVPDYEHACKFTGQDAKLLCESTMVGVDSACRWVDQTRANSMNAINKPKKY